MSTVRSKILVIIILATVFGLAGGMVGAIIARVYILEEAFNIPFIGEISFLGESQNGSHLVIRNPKKVVVEQNIKVIETVESASQGIVGLFKKVKQGKSETGTSSISVDNYYLKSEELSEAFIITSDGWILSSFYPRELKDLDLESGAALKAKAKSLGSYVVITKNKKVYEVDDMVYDEETGYTFWHVDASDLPVKRFVGPGEIANGQIVLAVNWEGWTWLTTVLGQKTSEALVRSSDEYEVELVLDEKAGERFMDSFLFDLHGDLLGLIDKDGQARPISGFLSCINCLLEDKPVKRASLGVNYLHLDSLVDAKNNNRKGALIYADKDKVAVVKSSAAAKAGLREGDIIISIDNIEIAGNNTLSQIISRYSAGEEISVVYSRGRDEKTARIVLGEKK